MTDSQRASTIAKDHDFLAGDGEIAALMRATDWSSTAVGPVDSWPRSLKTTVRIMLTSRYAMWMGWGSDLAFLYNDAYRPTLGVKHPWAIGKSAREVWPEIWPDVGPRIEGVLRTGVATWDEGLLLFLERSGFPEETYHTFSYSPLPDDEGAIGGMLCVVTEETERIIGERRLGLLRELASDLAGINAEGELCDAIGGRIGANPRDLPFTLIYLFEAEGSRARLACSTGFEAGDPAAPPAIEMGSADAPWPASEILEHAAPVMVDGLASRFDSLPSGVWDKPPRQAVVVPIPRQGAERPAGFLVAGINPYRPFDAAYAGFVGLLAGQVASGLANARAYEQERRRAEALAEVDRAKTAFFSNVSHEFRTPLTLLLGPVEDALGADLAPDQRDRMEVVHRNALRLQKLVNTLLDFSRIEAGRLRASYEPTDLAALTADLASVFRSAVEKAGMRLEVDCPPLGEPAFVDRDMWEKVVLNLVSNAFKFTLEGSIEVSLRREGGSAVLRVKDTGTGIPEEHLPQVFERFHRVEGARARTHEGTGIGLALVRELVGLHGGTVGVESVSGRGTTFSVAIPLGDAHLPADRVDARPLPASTALGANHYVEEALRWAPDVRPTEDEYAERPAAPDALEARRPRPRVLLADDNADMRDYVRRLLSGRYEVEAVPDGEAALDAARLRRPDLVLADVMMPRLDGFGLVERLRADPATKAVPIIMLSARAGEEARVEGLEAGVDDYLIKPFNARELMARVAALLDLAGLRLEAAENERALRAEAEAARERASTILESITDGFLALDRDWRFTYVNAEAERLTGLSRRDVIGRDFWGTFPGAAESDLGARYRAAVADQVTVEFDNFYGPRGRWFEIRAYPSKDGGLSVYFRDITGRKRDQAERERHFERERQRTEQLRRLAEVSIRISAANDVDSIVGIVAEEARELIQARDAVIVLDVDRRRVAPGPGLGLAARVDSLVRRSNRPVRLSGELAGRHRPADAPPTPPAGPPSGQGLLAAPLVGRDGKNLGVIRLTDKDRGEFTEDDEAILVQLAQMASVAVENARLYQELRDNDSRKNEFLAMLAHELRNPLAAVGNAVRLSTSSGLKDDVDWSMGVIARQLKHLSRLIDDLLDVSRISRGKIELRLGVVDVAPVLDSAVETVRPLVEERKHRLVVDFDRQDLWAKADPTRLEQVATNLLMNAAKYSENEGTIRLSAARQGDEVVISVKDSGVGIPPEKLPEMFELFAQGDRSLARSEGGLGIGLTVVKKLVELHGGSVSAHSEGPGLGSEFTVRFPASSRPDGPAPGPNGAGPNRRATARVLVVDDNVDTARGMARLLKLNGHEVRAVHSGPDAIEAARSFRPEFVLLDIGLPGMDGYKVAATLRGEDSGKGAVIVAVSGYGQEDDRRKSLEAGIDHHLVKPVDLDDLIAFLAGARAGRNGSIVAREPGPST